MRKRSVILTGILCMVLAIGTWISGLSLSVESASVRRYASKVDYLTQAQFATFFDETKSANTFAEESGETVFKLTRGTLFSKGTLPEQYTIAFKFKHTQEFLSLNMSFGSAKAEAYSNRIALDGDKNEIVFTSDGTTFLSQMPYRSTGDSGAYSFRMENVLGWFETNVWYDVVVKVEQTKLHFFLNGQYIYTIEDEDGFNGEISIKSGNIKPIFLKSFAYEVGSGQAVYDLNGQRVGTIFMDSICFEPGRTTQVVLELDEKLASSPTLRIQDSSLNTYISAEGIKQGSQYVYSIVPRGNAGWQAITFQSEKNEIGGCSIYLQHHTVTDIENENFEHFYTILQNQFLYYSEGNVYTDADGNRFRVKVGWVRDDVFTYEGSKYTVASSKEWIEFFIREMREDGMVFEKVEPSRKENTVYSYLPDDCYKWIGGDVKGVTRLELEADVEYLLVQAAYETWLASGDNAWMESVLPGLEKAMNYIYTDPTRWDAKLGVPIRVHTMDTWDFGYQLIPGKENRSISPWWEPKLGFDKTPMGVFYGDATGFWQASRQLAVMYQTIGKDADADKWLDRAASVRTNILKLAWNGEYFSSFIHTAPTIQEAPESWQAEWKKDANRLTLSNTFTLNREFFTQAQGASVITQYLEMRENPVAIETSTGRDSGKDYYAEWVFLYPAYTTGFMGTYPGKSVNATITAFCAGPLSNGTFKYGYSEYGIDILDRIQVLCLRDNRLPFVYNRDGSLMEGVGPDCWSAASIYAAITEGLNGFESITPCFDIASVTPAWTKTDTKEAYSSASFGYSDGYVAYEVDHTVNGQVTYQVVGSSSELDLYLLVPNGKIPTGVTVNGNKAPFAIKARANDVWACVQLLDRNSTDLNVVTVSYAEGTPNEDAFAFDSLRTEGLIFVPGADDYTRQSNNQNLEMMILVISLAVLVVFVSITVTVVVIKNLRRN